MAGRRQDQAGDRLHALGGFEIVVILFIFAIMGLLFLMVRTAFAPNATQISALRDENAALRACAANASDPALRQCVDQVRKGEPTTNTKPPLITLSEAAGYSFASGRTDVSSAFRGALTDKVIPQLIAAASLHRLDLIEVVGHTDEMAMAAHPQNLDVALVPYLNGQPSLDPSAASNVELGMIRAVAVAKILLADSRIRNAKIRVVPLSAGQLVLLNGLLSTGTGLSDPARRRIDLRLRKLGE